jgi:GNAT superfamily N-acetyltransferase
LTDPDDIRRRLEQDRSWSVYALGDLWPPFSARSEWYGAPEYANALALIYRADGVPVLLTAGEAEAVSQVLKGLPPEPEMFLSIRPEHLEAVRSRWEVSSLNPMWRMLLDPAAELPVLSSPAVTRLGAGDLPAIERLFADGEPAGEKPDFFFPSMLDDGTYFGVRESGELVAVAGTHLVVPPASVAAIGNVYTRRDRRGRGYGLAVMAAVVAELRQRQLRTIALNVRQSNTAAQRVYSRLGFRTYCAFFEGVARLRQE